MSAFDRDVADVIRQTIVELQPRDDGLLDHAASRSCSEVVFVVPNVRPQKRGLPLAWKFEERLGGQFLLLEELAEHPEIVVRGQLGTEGKLLVPRQHVLVFKQPRMARSGQSVVPAEDVV